MASRVVTNDECQKHIKDLELKIENMSKEIRDSVEMEGILQIDNPHQVEAYKRKKTSDDVQEVARTTKKIFMEVSLIAGTILTAIELLFPLLPWI